MSNEDNPFDFDLTDPKAFFTELLERKRLEAEHFRLIRLVMGVLVNRNEGEIIITQEEIDLYSGQLCYQMEVDMESEVITITQECSEHEKPTIQ